MNEWYDINNIHELDTPALVVYPDRVQKNIETFIDMAGDPSRLRPHVKTHKSPDVTKLLLRAGISKFKCATIAEAEMLAIAGAADVLLAYQPTGPKINRLLSLRHQYPATTFSCLIDNTDAATAINQAAAATAGIRLAIYIDLNVGMNRTGIEPGDVAVQLYNYCSGLSHLEPTGLHAYDGHIRNMDFTERKKACDEKFEEVQRLAGKIAATGHAAPLIIAGGSPTFSIHVLRKKIECSPGTFIYWDASYLDLCKEQPFLPAALVVTRIISLPAANRICTDLGHKSVAAENELTKRVFFLNAPELRVVSQSEEHLVLETTTGHHYKTGDVLYGLPYHICPTVALYERAITIKDGKISGEWWNVARDRKINN